MENNRRKKGNTNNRTLQYNRTKFTSKNMHKMLQLPEPSDLDVRNFQKLTRYQTLLDPRDMNAGRPAPLSGGVKPLYIIYVLHQDEVVLKQLVGSVLLVAHRFDVFGTHRNHNTGEFARGFVLLVVLGVESFETPGFPRWEKFWADAQNRFSVQGGI